ncbi:Cw13 [Schizosaccharomyces pombe]
MKNNYTSLKSSIDEEDELKTDHEIDLEKGLLPEYNSEEESTLPPYSVFYESWTKACGKGIKHFLKKWRNMFFAFCKSSLFCLVLLKAENKLSSDLGDQQWGWKCSASAFTFMAVSSILIFIAETVEPGSCSTDLVKRVREYCGYEARQHVNEYTAIPLREMNRESEA